MKTGDIVLIPFPFAELTQVKVRPAVVVAETKDKYKDLILAAISSQIPASISPAELIIKPGPLNGLRALSLIKIDRLFTLKTEKVITAIGKLSPNQTDEFKTSFKNLAD